MEHIDSDRDITLYINSPGGSFTSLMAIYDTMQFVRPDIQTVCVGQAASAAAVLLAGGTKGKRTALPNSRILIHQPATEGTHGQASDVEIMANEIMRIRHRLEDDPREAHWPQRRGDPRDIERDKILTAEEAKEYGIVDDVLGSRKTRAPPRTATGRDADTGTAASITADSGAGVAVQWVAGARPPDRPRHEWFATRTPPRGRDIARGTHR